jgi:nucleoid DNA-binding protein
MGKIIQIPPDGIADELAARNTIELRNFRKSCKGRNPKSLLMGIIPTHYVIKFRSGKELRTRIEALNPEKLKK